MSFTNENIWVIGASSGIGRALCEKLAGLGATLFLSSRRADELEVLRQQLGGRHGVYPLDVTNAAAVDETCRNIVKRVDRLDRVIFMAAIYRPQLIQDIDTGFARQLFETNVLGAMYCTHAVLPVLTQQACGQLVLCASVAGYTGLPGGQPYSASKAALINFAESHDSEAGKLVNIKVINPGFVRTPMTDQNNFPMPFRVEVAEAANAIVAGLNTRAFEIHFPRRLTYPLKFMALLPYSIQRWVKHRLSTRQQV